MDEERPFAKAAIIKDGVFSFIGEAKELASADARIPIESYTWLRFLHDDIEKVARANLVATIVDEEEVYKG